MKRIISITTIFVALLNVCLASSGYTYYNFGEEDSYAIDGNDIKLGKRPPVDHYKSSVDAYLPNKLNIKLKSEVISKSSPVFLLQAERGFVTVNNPALDNLNKRFEVSTYRSALYNLYQLNNSKSNSQRHAAWGLYDWYEVTLGDGHNVLEAMEAFLALDEVEIAEPIYNIVPISEIEIATYSNEEDSKFVPNDPHYSPSQWSFKNTGQSGGTFGIDIDVENAWLLTKGNGNVVISVHDSGIEYFHEDISSNMWEDLGPAGTNTIPGSHGTHVAGTIAAVSNNGVGVAGVAGGSGDGDGVKLMSVEMKFKDTTAPLTTLEGFIYAADNGAAISQNSWSYENPNVYNTPDLQGIDYFVSNGGGDALIGGGLVVFAAGNDDDNRDWYPGCYEYVLAVASHDNKGKKSSFSNYGLWVDITAPGSNIISTDINGKYSSKSGTSMACPHVTGVAALIISYAYGVLTPDELWMLLIQNTDDVYGLNPNYNGELGSGRLNASKAINGIFPYPVTVKVADQEYNALEGVPVAIDKDILYTNSDGEVVFEKFNGAYNLSVQQEGYHSSGGQIVINQDALEVKVMLIPETVELPEIIGVSEVCGDSYIFYNSVISHAGEWSVLGGEIIEAGPNFTLVQWGADVIKGEVYFNYLEDQGYRITNLKQVTFMGDLAEAQPEVVIKGDIPLVICTEVSVEGYKWLYNGTILPWDRQYFRADDISYQGNIWVEIVSENQCPNTSAAAAIDVEHKAKAEEDLLKNVSTFVMYPNPTSGMLVVDITNEMSGEVLIEVKDLLGRSVYRELVKKDFSELSHSVDLTNMAQGTYLVSVRLGSEIVGSKVLIKK